MKRLFFVFLAVLQSSILISQSLVVSGDTLVFGDASAFQLESHLTVKNISSTTENILCEKTIISQVSTGTNTFCWGGTCYGENTMISTKMDTLSPGESTNGFAGYYHPWGTVSVAVIEYCFYLDSDPNDKTCITITYNAGSSTSNIVLGKEEIIGSFYPNPAKDYTSLSFNINNFSRLEIMDVLGNVVKNIDMNEGVGKKTIYVGDLNKGIYFGNLVCDDEIIYIRKLIIDH